MTRQQPSGLLALFLLIGLLPVGRAVHAQGPGQGASPATQASPVVTSATTQDRYRERVLLPLVLEQYAPPMPAHLGYGANLASADHVTSLTEMGFEWAKGWATWERSASGPTYDWTAVDNQFRQFVPEVRHVLLRIGGQTGVTPPPVSAGDRAAFEAYCRALAVHVSETWRAQGLESVAYEIWNEPNLGYEWGGQPNPAQYAEVLKAGYRAIKAGDPQAIVVSAGLATTGGALSELRWAKRYYGTTSVVPDLTFLREMYRHGAKGHFDAMGSHPYGGRDAPETPPAAASGPIYFRRVEEQHRVMLEHGDESPVWITEFGWALATECHLGEHEWTQVSEAQQAKYLADAYDYAHRNWPWMGPMFLFNLDFGTVYWYANCDPVRWYSILYRENPSDPGNSPIRSRAAYESLRDMSKHSAW